MSPDKTFCLKGQYFEAFRRQDIIIINMIRLIGRKNSIAVQKVLWTSAELNLRNMERLNAGGKFGLPENYLSINPNGKVPTIIDSDGFSLWESHAICKYLVRKYAGKGKALCKYLSKICKYSHFAYFNSAIAELHYGNLLPNKFTIYPCLLDDCEPDNLNILCYNTISIGTPIGYALNLSRYTIVILIVNVFSCSDSHSNQRLYPTNDMQRVAHIDKWMDWKATTLYPHIQKLFMTMIRTAPADRDWAAYEAALKECDIKWTVVDKELLSNKVMIVID